MKSNQHDEWEESTLGEGRTLVRLNAVQDQAVQIIWSAGLYDLDVCSGIKYYIRINSRRLKKSIRTLYSSIADLAVDVRAQTVTICDVQEGHFIVSSTKRASSFRP